MSRKMRKEYLIDALARLTPEETLEVVSLAVAKNQTFPKKKEIPASKIDALKERHNKLIETTEIQFPIKLKGQIKLNIGWDSVNHCYLHGAKLILDEDQEAVNTDYFADLLEGREEQDYIASALERLEPLQQQGEKLINDIVALAEEYGADSEDLVEEITDDVAPRRLMSARKYRRRR